MQIGVREQNVKDGVRRTLRIWDTPQGEFSAFFDFLGEALPAPLNLLDGFVHAAFFPAMSIGGELRVHGPVTRQTLLNLMEMQDTWLSFRTGLYRPITIVPDEIVDTTSLKRPLSALSGFSGGLDSMFTLLRHIAAPPDPVRIPLGGAVFVDEVRGEDDFSNRPLLHRARQFLDTLSIPLMVLRTNQKTTIPEPNLNYSFAARLSAALHCYADRFSHALIASSKPYRNLVLPWGSSPLDNLFSSGAMTVLSDGAAFSRSEKAELVARHPDALRYVHVCNYKLPDNCGRCDKCVRTAMNFMVVGVPALPTMPAPLDLKQIDDLDMFSPRELIELQSIVEFAEEKGLQAPWLDRLRQRIGRYRPATRWRVLRKEWPLAVRRRLDLVAKAVRLR